MDNIAKYLLAAGIAILFPILVLFMSITIFPSKPAPSYPSPAEPPVKPYCSTTNSRSSGNSQSNSADNVTSSDNYSADYSSQPNYSSNCQQRMEQYQQELRAYNTKQANYDSQVSAYNKAVKANDKIRQINRSVLAVLIALVAIVSIYWIRDYKELAAGLTIGASLCIVAGSSMFVSFMGSKNIDTLAVVVNTAAFVVLISLFYGLENGLQKTVRIISTTPGIATALPDHTVIPSGQHTAEHQLPASPPEEHHQQDEVR